MSELNYKEQWATLCPKLGEECFMVQWRAKKQSSQLISTVVELYVNDLRSPTSIGGMVNLTSSRVTQILKFAGVLRSVSQALKLRSWNKKCLFCADEFVSQCPTQKFCKKCVPHHTASCRATNFGISQPEYEALLLQQQNACAICRQSFTGMSSRQILIDHCHMTDVVRGILCARCNTHMMAIDNNVTDWIKNALKYRMNVAYVPVWKRNK